MNIGLLSLQQAPPFSVPFRFFVTAPLFALAGCLLALIAGPELLISRWHPQLLALVHLFTLGVVTMVMAGALMQLLFRLLFLSKNPHVHHIRGLLRYKNRKKAL